MKNLLVSTFVLSSFLLAGTTFAAVKKDDCYVPIMTAMKTIAAINSKGIGMTSAPDLNYYKIEENGYFFDLSKVDPQNIKEDRVYEVKIINGMTSKLWNIYTYSAPEGCILRNLKSDVFN
jgi:hypothetical protein